jgi:hypothetical protein
MIKSISFSTKVAEISPIRRALVLALLAILSALLSTYASWESGFLLINGTPILPGIYFGLVLSFGVFCWTSRRKSELFNILVITTSPGFSRTKLRAMPMSSLIASLFECKNKPRPTVPASARFKCVAATGPLPFRIRARKLLRKIRRQNSYTLQPRPRLPSASRRPHRILKRYVTALGPRTRAHAREGNTCLPRLG